MWDKNTFPDFDPTNPRNIFLETDDEFDEKMDALNWAFQKTGETMNMVIESPIEDSSTYRIRANSK